MAASSVKSSPSPSSAGSSTCRNNYDSAEAELAQLPTAKPTFCAGSYCCCPAAPRSRRASSPSHLSLWHGSRPLLLGESAHRARQKWHRVISRRRRNRPSRNRGPAGASRQCGASKHRAPFPALAAASLCLRGSRNGRPSRAGVKPDAERRGARR